MRIRKYRGPCYGTWLEKSIGPLGVEGTGASGSGKDGVKIEYVCMDVEPEEGRGIEREKWNLLAWIIHGARG